MLYHNKLARLLCNTISWPVYFSRNLGRPRINRFDQHEKCYSSSSEVSFSIWNLENINGTAIGRSAKNQARPIYLLIVIKFYYSRVVMNTVSYCNSRVTIYIRRAFIPKIGNRIQRVKNSIFVENGFRLNKYFFKKTAISHDKHFTLDHEFQK